MSAYDQSYADILDDSNSDQDETSLEKMKRTDYHCWVEDASGKCVFDPEFFGVMMIKDFRRCVGDTIRMPFLNQEECLKLAIRDGVERIQDGANFGFHNLPWNIDFDDDGKGRFLFCNLNCLNFLRENKNKGYMMVVGGSGWRTKDGDVWIEWG